MSAGPLLPPKALSENPSCLFQLLETPGILLFETAPLQPLLPSSHSFLLCVSNLTSAFLLKRYLPLDLGYNRIIQDDLTSISFHRQRPFFHRRSHFHVVEDRVGHGHIFLETTIQSTTVSIT